MDNKPRESAAPITAIHAALRLAACVAIMLACHGTVAAQEETVALTHRLKDDSSHHVFELSNDLTPSSWAKASLEFDQETETWALTGPLPGSDAAIEITDQVQHSDGSWALTFRTPVGDSVFTRILAVGGITREDGNGLTFPVDPTATRETYALLHNLHRIGWSDRFMMGHEFPLSFTLDGSGDNDPSTSDIKDVVGDHPGVHGSDFHFMIDKSPAERARHIAAASTAYKAGAVVTFDYHWQGRHTATHDYRTTSSQAAANIAAGDNSAGDIDWFEAELDQVLDIINTDLQFPIVFRPFHEMDGGWFWWGAPRIGGAGAYRLLYQRLVDYMRERTDLVLYCWSPDVSNLNFQQFYPGDNYVDVIGRDIYSFANGQAARSVDQLIATIDFAEERGKVAAFTETGYTAGGESFETGFPTWWNGRLLNTLKQSGRGLQIAWTLTWINTSWSGPYVPHKNSPQAAKSDFVEFYNDPATLFESEVAAERMYQLPEKP